MSQELEVIHDEGFIEGPEADAIGVSRIGRDENHVDHVGVTLRRAGEVLGCFLLSKDEARQIARQLELEANALA